MLIAVFFQLFILAIAVFLLYGGWTEQRRVRRITATPRTACADVGTLVTSARAGGAGEVRCEVAGTARAVPGGLLRAPFSGTPCLWFRVTVTHREPSSAPSSTSDSRRVTDFADESSQPFVVADASGAVLVRPSPGSVDFPETTFDTTHQGPTPPVPLPPGVRLGRHSHTYRETVIREGVPLYVLGAADLDANGPVIHKPGSGAYEISCKSEEDTAKSSRLTSRILYAAGGVLLVGDAVWIILSLS